MYGDTSHPIDLLRWFFGDVEEVHAYGRKGNLTPEYPYEDNYLINLKFANGVIPRVFSNLSAGRAADADDGARALWHQSRFASRLHRPRRGAFAAGN